MFLTFKKFLLLYLPNLHGHLLGKGEGGDLSISYLNQNCFGHGEGSFKESMPQTVLLEMSCEISG